MEPIDLLKQAVTTVEQANVPGDLRTLAFAKVLEILSGPSVPDSSTSEAGNHYGEEGASTQFSTAIASIASNLGIPSTLVDRILDEHEGELIFSGDVSALGKNRSDKVHSLAILLLAGRRWAGLDGGGATSDEVLRAEVDRLGLLDTTNYTKHVATLKPFVTITGSGRKAVYKIKYDGIEKAKELGRALAGAE
jgi:hypothetical protein